MSRGCMIGRFVLRKVSLRNGHSSMKHLDLVYVHAIQRKKVRVAQSVYASEGKELVNAGQRSFLILYLGQPRAGYQEFVVTFYFSNQFTENRNLARSHS